MNWREAATAFSPLEEKDIAHMQLSKEEKEQVLTLFNRAESNAQGDSADIAMIALKKLLTQYPSWGEAALLYGICLAIDGKYKRAAASFEHAVSAGLQTEDLSFMAQVCFQDASRQYAHERRSAQNDDETARKSMLSSILPSWLSRKSVYREIESEERGHMQAPILTRVPRSTGKTKLATDRERRDVMMQSNSPNGDNMDDEIDVSIPKTPAEKLRIALIAFGSVVLAVLLGLSIWFLLIPAIASIRENKAASTKLEYLLTALEAQQSDPQVSQILSDYQKMYLSGSSSAQTIQAEPTQTAQTEPAPTSEIPQDVTTVPVQGSSAVIMPGVQAIGESPLLLPDTTASQDAAASPAAD